MKLYTIIRNAVHVLTYMGHRFVDLVYGIIKLSKLKKAPVTIFGGSGLAAHSTYRQEAHLVAHALTNLGIPVLMGGASTYLPHGCTSPMGKQRKKHKKRTESITVKSEKGQDNTC